MADDSRILFFLGAGASVYAGVPDTRGMVSEFRRQIAESTANNQTIDRILRILTDHRPLDESIDVELLLETLERLENQEHEVVLWFYELDKYALEGYSAKRPLISELKDFIKKEAIVDANRIRYLEPLLEFMEERPLDVFSVNYDTCIEQFCDTYRKDLQDGFDLYWNPESFERSTDVRLYKLHGSVTWYRSDTGRYLKIPIISESSTIELTSRERAESLVLYPFHKWTYAEPMLELLVELKRKLEGAHYVFVVGYSFRDDHIRRLFWDAANRNRALVVFLIGPNAPEIYNKKLRYHDQGSSRGETKIPSSLDGRVILLPYKFENVLPRLKNYYLHDLSLGQGAEREARTAELKGQEASWTVPFWYFSRCEYVSKIQELLSRVSWNSIDAARKAEISFGVLVSAICQGESDLAHSWAQRFSESIPWLEANIKVQVAVSPKRIILQFTSDDSYIPVTQVKNSLEVLNSFVYRSYMTPLERARPLRTIGEGFNRLSEYLALWRDDGIDYATYVDLRRNLHIAELEEIWALLGGFDFPNYDQSGVSVAAERIERVETTIINEILNPMRKALLQDLVGSKPNESSGS